MQLVSLFASNFRKENIVFTLPSTFSTAKIKKKCFESVPGLVQVKGMVHTKLSQEFDRE